MGRRSSSQCKDLARRLGFTVQSASDKLVSPSAAGDGFTVALKSTKTKTLGSPSVSEKA